MKKIKIIALAAALVAALALYQLLKEISKPQETPRTDVVVAAVDIPENTEITADMVMLSPVATEALLPNVMKDPESVIGMVLSSDVYAGEQIVSERLVRMGETESRSNTLAYVIEPGMRAVTINVTPSTGGGNLVKPGNHVDVIMNYAYPEKSTNGQDDVKVEASRLLLQDVQVLAVDAILSKDGATAEGYTTITLMVTPEQVTEVSFAEYTANLRVVLRSALDEGTVPEKEIILDTIRGEATQK